MSRSGKKKTLFRFEKKKGGRLNGGEGDNRASNRSRATPGKKEKKIHVSKGGHHAFLAGGGKVLEGGKKVKDLTNR